MSKKKILILGSGGRESAIAWKLNQSEQVDQLFIAPGNAGTSDYGENINLDIRDFNALATFCEQQQIDYVIPGSEELLVDGIADYFTQYPFTHFCRVIGPIQKAAALEGSKDFAKEFMGKNGIPTARYRTFTKENYEEGKQYLREHSLPIVLKADGLAAGKGVVIATTHEEALVTFEAMIQEAMFGKASAKVVIEQFLVGIESSAFIFTDGKNYFRLPDAKDYKRIGEQDTGLNTGGMGAVSPVDFMQGDYERRVTNEVIIPTIEGLKKDGIPYIGFIFFGLINVEGAPYVIEYNCRLGDPETEVILPRLEGDLIDLFTLIDEKEDEWKKVNLKISNQHAATVMSVSGGYPEEFEKGKMINVREKHPSSLVFYAGAQKSGDQIITTGGRVLAVTSLGSSLQEALMKSYQQLSFIDYEQQYYRKDIGYEFK